jgi:hypothetical protein
MAKTGGYLVEPWKDAYFQSLTKVDKGTEPAEALDLKRSNFPPALYRYRSLERLAYLLEELRDNYLYLSQPAGFNDPYDSGLSISWEHILKQAIEEHTPEYPVHLAEYVEEAFANSIQGFFLSAYGMRTPFSDLFSTFREKLGVSCFATDPKSVVMWSHYANQHRGICLEFPCAEMLTNKSFLKILHPVRYTDNFRDVFRLFWPPNIELDQVSPDILPILAACHKSEEWSYEGEWRLVSMDLVSGRKFFLRSCNIKPSRIILGAKIEQPNRAAIEELAQKISVPVVSARLSKDRFEIEF